MAYFAPYIDETGLHIPTYNDILEKRIADAKAIFGQDIYLGNDAADYQSIAVESLALSECMQAIQYAYNQMSPVTAIGVGLSSLVQLNGLTRQPASYSTCDVTLTGTAAATITNGKVLDIAGKTWDLPASVTLSPAGGGVYSALVTATCEEIGAINAVPGDISIIGTPTAGWTGVTNASVAIAGVAVETDAELRERQAISVALPSQTMLAGTIAGIASLASVTRYKVYENATSSTHFGDSGVPFEGSPVHSITPVVEGGEIEDIAQIIYANRGIGCYTDGDIVTDIVDSIFESTVPIRFYRPEYVPIYVELSIHALTGYLTTTADDIKAAVSAYINMLEIGQTLTVSSVIAAAMSVMVDFTKPTFSIYATLIGTSLSPALEAVDIEVGYKEVVWCDEVYVEVNLV